MTRDPSDDEIPVDAGLAALLADVSLWQPTDAAIEDAIAAEIAAEIGGGGGHVGSAPGAVVPISSARRWRGPLVAGAAAIVLVVAAFAIDARETDPAGVELALEATELAPEASGSVAIDDTPLGSRLILDVSGLPPAPEGTYYEAWLRTGPEVGVSAGTFHLRGGDGEIELWAGVSVADYPLFTITVQDEGDPLSSGQVVLRGRVSE